MSDVAIRVEALCKAYRLGLQDQKHETLASALAAALRSPFENLKTLRRLSRFDDALGGEAGDSPDLFWALRNLSFEIKRGEVVGIIGRNGAGKSTLLKLLARITEPTAGRASIYGRVASLLEVGTGFHPDLTGRENIYLNGTILGMRKREVDRKFDEIVGFSEIEKFIDTPVKRYSSGMRMRLAFSVAAHLEPEILIVDEVLAVGDMNFQKKCVGKMGEVAQQGRTVLFVSHNMAAVVELCQRGIVLESGRLAFDGTAAQGVSHYVQRTTELGDAGNPGGDRGGFSNLLVNGANAPTVASTDPIRISVRLAGETEGNPWIYFIMEDSSGQAIIHSRMEFNEVGRRSGSGPCVVTIDIPALQLSPGVYSVYFKMLSAQMDGPSRLWSERVPVEVRGFSDSLGHSILSPAMRWGLGDQ